MRSRHFLILFLFVLSGVYSQNRSIDSLKRILEKTKEDTAKIALLLEIGDVDKSDTLTSLRNAQDAKLLSQKIKYFPGVVNSLILFSNIYIQAGRPAQAAPYLDKAEKIYREQKLPASFLLKVMQTKGNLKWQMGKYEDALKIYTEALVKAEEINDIARASSLISNILAVYRETEQFDLALKYAGKALKYAGKINDNITRAHLYNNIGSAYADKEMDDSALKYQLKALHLRLNDGDQFNLAMCHHNVGLTYYYKNELSKAVEHLSAANKIWEKTGNRQGLAVSYMMVGQIYLSRNESAKAVEVYKKGLAYVKEVGTPLQIQDYYDFLAAALYHNKQYKEAYETHLNYSKAHDSLVNKDSRRAMIEMQTKYETEKKEKENELLVSQNKINVLEIDNQKTQRNIMAIVFVFVLFAGFVLYTRFRLKSRNRILEEKNLRNIAVLKGQEEEKVKLSKELHDGVGPLLSLIKLNASSIQPNEENKKIIDDIKGLASEGMKEVRNISHALMPSLLEKKGLEPALAEFFEQVQQSSQIKVHFTYTLSGQLQQDVQLNLYRIIQEAINNTLRYAEAKNISVELKSAGQETQLLIKDDGVGFDPELTKEGNGLSNMHSRADLINGKLKIESAKGKGTVIFVRV